MLETTVKESASTTTAVKTRPVAMVTGGVRGIGRAIAEEFWHEGYEVVVTYCTSDTQAEAMRQLFPERMDVLRADVSLETEVEQLFDDVLAQFGRVDVLVNNAGITQDRSFHKMETQHWHRVIDVNLNGTFYCCNRAVPLMRQQGFGRIINISSVVGQKGNFGQANYAASKAGMLGLTKTLALENALKGITVNAVCPGFIETDMVQAIPDLVQDQIKDQIPMKRFGTAGEVAKAVKFLASPDAAYITGQELNVNGGLLTH